jgi:DNA repair exonuclease SbcCD ATPase subunit
MEINFKKLQFRNFLSYGNNLTTFEFAQSGTTLIVGENLDQTNQGNTSNGVGKSTLINALVYALYNKPLSDISKDNLINNTNKKNMEVVVEFDIGEDSYKIKRERKAKTGNNTYFWVNGEDKTCASAADTDAAIGEILGIQYDLFVQIVVFSTSHSPFLKLTKSEQTGMFERLVGLTMLSDKATSLKELIKDTETGTKIKKARIEVLEAEHERYTTQLQNAKVRMDDWTVTHNTNIQELQDCLDSIVEPDFDKEQAAHEELATISNQLTQETKLLTHLQEKLQEFKSLQRQLDMIGDIDTDKEQKLHEEINVILNLIDLENIELDQSISNVADLKRLNLKLIELGDVDFKGEEIAHTDRDAIIENIKIATISRDADEQILTTQTIKRLKLLEELAHLKSNKCPYCSQLYKDATSKIADVEGEIFQLEAAIQAKQSELDANERLIESANQAQKALSEKITTSSLTALLKLKNEVDVIVSKIDDLEKLDCNVSVHSNAVMELKKKKEAINAQLTTSSVQDLQKIKSDMDRIKAKLEDENTTESDILDVEQSIETLKSTQVELNATLTTTSVRELLQIKNENNNIRGKLETAKSTTNPHEDSYQELLNADLENINYDDINTLTKALEHQKLLLKLLTKKDSFVRRSLLQRYILFINSQLKHYLSEIGLPHKVEFTHEMTVEISQMGRILDYGQLSAGQQARLNLSLSLAFSDVLQKLHSKVNIQALDEILDTGLDSVGIQAAAKIVKTRAESTGTATYVISHKEEVQNMFDNIMTIQMIKGFSYVKNQGGEE